MLVLILNRKRPQPHILPLPPKMDTQDSPPAKGSRHFWQHIGAIYFNTALTLRHIPQITRRENKSTKGGL